MRVLQDRDPTHIEHHAAFPGVRLAQMSAFCAEFIVIWVVIDTFKSIGTWSAYEVLFLHALNLSSYTMAGSFFYQPRGYLRHGIRSGEFDLVLTFILPYTFISFYPARYFLSKNGSSSNSEEVSGGTGEAVKASR